MAKTIRIQKYLGDGGILSRRKTEEYIKAGRITVNGRPAAPGHPVAPGDVIAIDGQRVRVERDKENLYLMLNKPRGYVTTTSDELGRRCVTQLLEGVEARVYPVGRLDRDSEGLLLLTNDGQFANLIMHPSHHIGKTYRVTVRPGITEDQCVALAAGVDGFLAKPFFVSTFRQALESLGAGQGGRPAPAPEDALKGLFFLVAEDNELNAEILSEMLDIEGARCEIVPNGRLAVERFNAAPPDRYDMILMDVQMPEMDGYEATRRIRASGGPRAKEIPIVAMTANAFAEDVRHALDAGMNGHLSKPINMDAVRELLGRLREE